MTRNSAMSPRSSSRHTREREAWGPEVGGRRGPGIEGAEGRPEGERDGDVADVAQAETDASEPRDDPAAIEPQLERAEGEGMVTEHAKVSATDPGPHPQQPVPVPVPVPEPEPDHGPEDPEWEDDPERE
jgi:hypothetical protein